MTCSTSMGTEERTSYIGVIPWRNVGSWARHLDWQQRDTERPSFDTYQSSIMHRLTFDQSSVACSWAGYENALYSCSSTTPAPLVSFTPGRDRLFSSTAVSACRRNQDMSSTFRLMLLLGFPLGMIAFVDLPAMYLQSPDAMTKSHITEPGELAPSAPTKETYEYVDPTDDQIRSLQRKSPGFSFVYLAMLDHVMVFYMLWGAWPYILDLALYQVKCITIFHYLSLQWTQINIITSDQSNLILLNGWICYPRFYYGEYTVVNVSSMVLCGNI